MKTAIIKKRAVSIVDAVSVQCVSQLQMGLIFLDCFLPTLPQQATLITCSSIGHSKEKQHK